MQRTKRARRGRPPGRERAADPDVTLIKKYGNRRLYDTQRSRYITLDDLCEMIAGGEEVKVIDAKTGEDLTKRVVTKIIFLEEERRSLDLLPLAFLRKLIEHRDDTMREFYQRYLALSVEVYRSSRQRIDEVLLPPVPGISPRPATPGPEHTLWRDGVAVGRGEGTASELEELKARIAALEARVGGK